MQLPPTSFLEWTRKFATEESRLAELARRRWPGGFISRAAGTTGRTCFSDAACASPR